MTDALLQDQTRELYLLVRDPGKLRLETRTRPNVTILRADMREVGQFADLLRTIDVAVLAASAWGGTEAHEINVTRTLELLNLLDPTRCQQVIYFSTASLLDHQHRPLRAAGEFGTYYIRSKYECLRQLPDLPIAPRLTILFPTLVLGGDDQKPYSSVSDGLPNVLRWMDLIRFFRLDASFHFIHGRDIAQVVRHCVEHPPTGHAPRTFVLGQAPLTINQAIEETCAYLNKRIYFRIPAPLALADLSIAITQNGAPDSRWDRFCLRYRHFTYAGAINPGTLGLPNYCATLTDVLRLSGIPRAATPAA